MEQKVINAVLKKVEDKDCIVFMLLGKQNVVINLNSEDQSNLKDLFYLIVKDLFAYDISISLDIDQGYDVGIFIEIAREYIAALNDEINKVKSELPKKEKSEVSSKLHNKSEVTTKL